MLCSFNGAAPARARNSPVPSRCRHRPECFNGAAPRGRGIPARRLERGLATASTGPRRAGAELCQLIHGLLSMTTASTGPRPRGRGIVNGHGVAASDKISFNGAAPARARNYQHAGHLHKLRWASTGPRPRGRGIGLSVTPSGASSQDFDCDCLHRFIASMLVMSNCLIIIDSFQGGYAMRARTGFSASPRRSRVQLSKNLESLKHKATVHLFSYRAIPLK